MSDADEVWLKRLAGGDMQALEKLYDSYSVCVYQFLLAQGLSREEAEEGLCEVFLALAARGRKLREVRNVRAYLLGIARHYAARQHKSRPPQAINACLPNPEKKSLVDVHTNSPPASEMSFAALQMLQQLPPEQAAVIVLKIWHGLTFAEIAAALNISADTAASRYRYGLEKLRALWQED